MTSGSRWAAIFLFALALAAAGCETGPETLLEQAEEERDTLCAILFHKLHSARLRANWTMKTGGPRQAITEYEGIFTGLEDLRRRNKDWNVGSVAIFEAECRAEMDKLQNFMKLKDARAAEAMARFVVRRAADPDSAAPYSELGDFFFAEREYENALRQYRQALRKDRGNVGVQIAVARIYTRMGDYDTAKDIYRGIIDANPHVAVVHYNLGGIYFRMKRPTYAIREYTRAIELQPGYPEAHNALGTVFKQLGRYEEAIEHYKAAIQIAPDYAPAWENLGLSFMAQNNYPTAMNYLRRAVELFGPDSPQGRAISDSMKHIRRYR